VTDKHLPDHSAETACCAGCAACHIDENIALESADGERKNLYSESASGKTVAAKKTLYLRGLDCADCANMIEAAVGRIDGVQKTKVDFVTQKLMIEVFDQDKLTAIVSQAEQLINRLEPDLVISAAENTTEVRNCDTGKDRAQQIRLAAGAAFFVVGMVMRFPLPLEFAVFLVSYLLVGGEIIWRALKNLMQGRVFDENFLMSVATIGAFAIGEFAEGVAVMLFYRIGEFFEDLAVNRSRRSIAALMDIRPDYANLKVGDGVRRVAPDQVAIGELILVRPGEKVPLDGIVVEGRSSVDTSALTGESMPRDLEVGAEILSGSLNHNGLLTVKVTKEFGESTVSKILELVENASSQKSPTENFITRFARYYTPVVVFAAIGLAIVPPVVIGAPFTDWLSRALTFLVVSCPCALVISIPLSFFGGIGGASKKGILVKGSNYLQALNHLDTVVFDKTGTLTKGNFKVSTITAADGWAEDELLFYAAHAEIYANHPIAASIRQAYGRELDAQHLAEYEEISGHGVRVKVDGRKVLAGNKKLMITENIDCLQAAAAGTVVYLAIDGKFAGSIVIADEIKPDSAQAVRRLKDAGVRRTVMLTGDSKATAEKVAGEIGIDDVYSELLPQQKVQQLEALLKNVASGGKLVFVGDGINDAPVLARADIGVAMGGLGSDAAIEAADVVLMTDEPSKLVTAIGIAKKTRSIVWQNIIFALSVKVIILVLAAMGIATMWQAVFGDVGVTIIAVLNAIKATQVKDVA